MSYRSWKPSPLRTSSLLVKDVHEAVELDDEAGGVPDRGVVVGVQVVLEPKLPEVAHDAPRQGLAVCYEEDPLGFAGLDEPLQTNVVFPEP